jgi:hypothetical protein
MDQKHLFFFHLLLGDEDLAIELFRIRIPSLAPLFVFRPIFARRPPKTSQVRMLQRVFLARLAMLRKNCQKLQSWTSSVQSGILKALLLSCLLPSFLPFVDDRQSTYLAKSENKDTVVSTAGHPI